MPPRGAVQPCRAREAFGFFRRERGGEKIIEDRARDFKGKPADSSRRAEVHARISNANAPAVNLEKRPPGGKFTFSRAPRGLFPRMCRAGRPPDSPRRRLSVRAMPSPQSCGG